MVATIAQIHRHGGDILANTDSLLKVTWPRSTSRDVCLCVGDYIPDLACLLRVFIDCFLESYITTRRSGPPSRNYSLGAMAKFLYATIVKQVEQAPSASTGTTCGHRHTLRTRRVVDPPHHHMQQVVSQTKGHARTRPRSLPCTTHLVPGQLND